MFLIPWKKVYTRIFYQLKYSHYLNETGLKHSVGYFEIDNRNNTNSSDDIVGYLSVLEVFI